MRSLVIVFMYFFVAISFRSNVLLTSVHSRIFFSTPSSMSKDGRTCFLFKGPIIPTLCKCSTQICTQSLSVSYSKWLCTSSFFFFLSHSNLSGVYLTCLNLILMFLLSLQSYKLSLEESLMPFWPLSMAFIAIIPPIFPLLASPS